MSTLNLSVIGFFSRAMFMAVIMLNIILLARYLEPQGRGEYFLFQTVMSILTILADCGVSQSANVFAGRYAERARQIHSVLLQFVCILWGGALVIGGSVLAIGGNWLLPNFQTKWLLVAFGTLPMTLYAGMWNSMMVGLGEIWSMNMVQLCMAPLQLILIWLFVVILSGGVASAVLIYVFTMLIQFGVMFLLMARRFEENPVRHIRRDLAWEMWSFAMRGYANGVASLLWTRVPVFLLNSFHGIGPVGVFSVAQQLAEKILLPVQALQDAVYRKMAVLAEREATAIMNRYLRMVAFGTLAVVVAGTVLAPSLVGILFGDAYFGATQLFRVLLVGVAFVGMSLILGAYMLSHLRRPGLLSILAGANVFVCFAFSLWFIPGWAEIGAALALVLTQILGGVVAIVFYLRLAPAQWRDAFVLNRDDIALICEQVSTALWWKRAKA